MAEINSLFNKIAAGDRNIAEEANRINADLERRRRNDVGPLYDVMVSDRSQAIRCLHDSNRSTRKVAIQLFMRHWHADADIEEVIERYSYNNERDVQLAAIITIAFIRNRSGNVKVSSTLANYALNSAVEWGTRRAVYSYLLISFGSLEQREHEFRATRESKAEGSSSIDPEVVRSCVERDTSASHSKLAPYMLESTKFFQEGKSLFESKRFGEAERLLTKAIEVWPDAAGAFSVRAKARVAMGRTGEALADCNTAISLAPNIASLYRHRARLYEQLGKIDLASDDYRKADFLER